MSFSCLEVKERKNQNRDTYYTFVPGPQQFDREGFPCNWKLDDDGNKNKISSNIYLELTMC